MGGKGRRRVILTLSGMQFCLINLNKSIPSAVDYKQKSSHGIVNIFFYITTITFKESNTILVYILRWIWMQSV